MFCAIWYHLYNFKNVKNIHGRVLLLVKLQAFSLKLYEKLHSAMGVFHVLNSTNGTKSRNASHCFKSDTNLSVCITLTLHKKWSFLLRFPKVNVTKYAVSCGFRLIFWGNRSWKTSFLCSARYYEYWIVCYGRDNFKQNNEVYLLEVIFRSLLNNLNVSVGWFALLIRTMKNLM